MTRHPVLVICHADGYVEVFGDSATDTKIVPIPAMLSNAGDILAEKYLETILPQRYRDIYYPGNLLAMGQCRTITPSMIADRNLELAMVRTLDNIQHEVGRAAS
jgi:hypothetical protein